MTTSDDPDAAETKRPLKRFALERLTRYCQCAFDGGCPTDSDTITSAEIGRFAEVDAAQVRRDLAGIGVSGVPHVGFNRAEVLAAIRSALSLDANHDAVIIGAGRLGGALASYVGFANYGVSIVSLFDSDPRKVGAIVAGCVIRPAEQMEQFIAAQQVRLAILTLPPGAAQPSADQAVRAGVRVIWNLTPARLTLPDTVYVRRECLAIGLGVLVYQLGRIEG